jgi:2-polyprenyl-3-methyl-5-hydroxy-6-metoxy-1,4-benzoquinol methylase
MQKEYRAMSASQVQGNQPSPALFFETAGAYQRSYALKTAVELDLFTAIAKGSHTVEQIAAACAASQRGTRILCDFLTIQGFMTKQDGRYSLTPDSALFLDSRLPTFVGRAVAFLVHPFQVANFAALGEAVRRGKQSETAHDTMSPDDAIWKDFARGMAPMIFPVAQQIAAEVAPSLGTATKPKVLDVAAGHGMFGIAIAQQNSKADIYALDWASVLEVAQENARASGVADRYHLVPGSAFDTDFGSDHDLVLLTNFLHHFTPEVNEGLLKKAAASLKSGGQIAIAEFVPNADRVSPPTSAGFSLVMLANTEQGDAYTFAELERMCRNAGFEDVKQTALQPIGFQTLVTARKK